jgi:type II secretory pathway component GspD/PulD (secretin)
MAIVTVSMPIIRFNNTPLRDILGFIGSSTGINVTYDRQYQDRNYTVQLDGVTLEQALNQILGVNGLSYKVLSERSILIFEDNAGKHQQYDDQVIQTFYLSNADATELAQLLSQAFRPPGIAVQPAIAPNKAQNSITIRATAPVVGIFEKLIQQNDKPRAEIVVDVEIMEVNRQRVKQYGLNLSEYALGGIFSPEVSPNGASTTTTTTTPATGGVTAPVTTGTAATGTGRTPSGLTSPPAFNLNTITRGFSTADFYTAVPTAIAASIEPTPETASSGEPNRTSRRSRIVAMTTSSRFPQVCPSAEPHGTAM